MRLATGGWHTAQPTYHRLEVTCSGDILGKHIRHCTGYWLEGIYLNTVRREGRWTDL